MDLVKKLDPLTSSLGEQQLDDQISRNMEGNLLPLVLKHWIMSCLINGSYSINHCKQLEQSSRIPHIASESRFIKIKCNFLQFMFYKMRYVQYIQIFNHFLQQLLIRQ